MSCDGNDSFGYVKIEDDMVVAYTGESNNPTVHKFCNDDIVQAVKLKKIVEKWLKDSDIPDYRDWTYHNLTKFLEECKK